MAKVKYSIIKVLIVLISIYFIDGGISLTLVSSNIQVIINQNHTNDIDIPDQHHSVNFNEDEKWFGSYLFDFACFNNNPVKFLYASNTTSQELPDSIWQPPEFV